MPFGQKLAEELNKPTVIRLIDPKTEFEYPPEPKEPKEPVNPSPTPFWSKTPLWLILTLFAIPGVALGVYLMRRSRKHHLGFSTAEHDAEAKSRLAMWREELGEVEKALGKGDCSLAASILQSAANYQGQFVANMKAGSSKAEYTREATAISTRQAQLVKQASDRCFLGVKAPPAAPGGGGGPGRFKLLEVDGARRPRRRRRR